MSVRSFCVSFFRASVTAFLLGVALLYALPAIAASPKAGSAIPATVWKQYRQADTRLRTADDALNTAYKNVMRVLPASSRKALLDEQRQWLSERDTRAAAAHAVGTPGYINALTAATALREKNLQERYTSAMEQASHALSAQKIAAKPQAAPTRKRSTLGALASYSEETGVTVAPLPKHGVVIRTKPAAHTEDGEPAPETTAPPVPQLQEYPL